MPTPALVVDAAALERNLERMAAHAKAKDIGLRPHVKTHKCPLLAKRQLDLGAVGVCAAKVSEAEVMVDAGIEAVLITSPVVTRDKIARVVELARRSPERPDRGRQRRGGERLHERRGQAKTTVGVVIDLDPGMRRTGIAPGAPALELPPHRRAAGAALRRAPVLRRQRDARERLGGRRKRSHQALERAIETKALLEREGFEVRVFTGGGTGTFDIDCDVDAFTDLQVGSYLFMDVGYRRCGGSGGAVFDDFEPSLFILATAISQPARDSSPSTPATRRCPRTRACRSPRVEGVIYKWGGDEHGILELEAPSRPIRLGDQVTLVVPHCDPTVNLYDVIHPYRDGRVEELWPISARGKSQ